MRAIDMETVVAPRKAKDHILEAFVGDAATPHTQSGQRRRSKLATQIRPGIKVVTYQQPVDIAARAARINGKDASIECVQIAWCLGLLVQIADRIRRQERIGLADDHIVRTSARPDRHGAIHRTDFDNVPAIRHDIGVGQIGITAGIDGDAVEVRGRDHRKGVRANTGVDVNIRQAHIVDRGILQRYTKDRVRRSAEAEALDPCVGDCADVGCRIAQIVQVERIDVCIREDACQRKSGGRIYGLNQTLPIKEQLSRDLIQSAAYVCTRVSRVRKRSYVDGIVPETAINEDRDIELAYRNTVVAIQSVYLESLDANKVDRRVVENPRAVFVNIRGDRVWVDNNRAREVRCRRWRGHRDIVSLSCGVNNQLVGYVGICAIREVADVDREVSTSRSIYDNVLWRSQGNIVIDR